MTPRDRIVEEAKRLGFARVAFAPAAPFERGKDALNHWLDAGRHGTMSYMARHDRADPATVMPGAKTIVVVALAYPRFGRDVAVATAAPRFEGKLADYARGEDYHRVMRDKLERLAGVLAESLESPVRTRAIVDSAPLLEREAAEASGLAFFAKNTMAIAPGLGSNFLLGELLVDIEIAPDEAIAPRCGDCRACLDACPTRAFVDAYVLDARRCISYLTIEYRGVIPRELRPLMGTWVFGCDICQQVCPFNASPKQRPYEREFAPRANLQRIDLEQLLAAGSSEHKRLTHGTALRRAPRHQLARNAAVALGNTSDSRAVPALERAASKHRHPLVRGHAVWALAKLGEDVARLEDAEQDSYVLSEITQS